MRDLLVTPQFENDFTRIPAALHVELDVRIAFLRKDPYIQSLNPKKLRVAKAYVWRIRIGHYRLLYTFNATSLTLLRIRHRKDVYRNL